VKKIIAIVLALLIVLSFAACGNTNAGKTEGKDDAKNAETDNNATSTADAADKTEEKEDAAAPNISGLANPYQDVASLEELNEAVGSHMYSPGVMGVSDESYTLIKGDNPTAQYKFSVAGHEYTFRASKETEDISGCYVDGKTVFSGITDRETIHYGKSEGSKLAQWFVEGVQYVLNVKDEDDSFDMESFGYIAEEMASYTLEDVDLSAYYEALVGDYNDSFSQRAYASVSLNEDGYLDIQVSWGSSAFEVSVWTMTGRYEFGKVIYYDGARNDLVTDEEGNDTSTTVYEYAGGYFEVKDGKLLWTGAEEESCRECCFEK